MRRVAHQRHAIGNEGIGQAQRQWIGIPPPGQTQIAKKAAETGPQDVEIFSIGQRVQIGGIGVGFSPDDAGAIAGQR